MRFSILYIHPGKDIKNKLSRRNIYMSTTYVQSINTIFRRINNLIFFISSTTQKCITHSWKHWMSI